LPGDPAHAEDPAPPAVYVGVYLHDVSSFDQKDGVFDADLELWAKWRGELDHERIEITNAGAVERVFIGLDDDRGWRSARWRVRGTLRGEFPLHDFPFDQQTIAVTLELPEQYGTLVPDLASSGMAERFSLTDWHYDPEFDPEVSEEVFASDLGNLAHEGSPTSVNRVSYQVRLTRPIVPVILKLFLPLGIIMLVALASLFVAPDQIEARSAMGVTSLLSCFAFQFTVSDSLPAVAYLTLADSLFILGYIVSTTVVVETIVSYALAHKGKHQIALWVDRVMRVAVPVAAAATMWAGIPDSAPERVAQPDPLPELPRHASARDTLRIGTNILPSITGAVYSDWGLIHEDPALGKQVVYVERAPGVDNDALRFLAGGQIEVTWRIREGAKWSDGTDVTASDVLFGLELSPEPHVVEATTPDPRTVVLRWDERLASALEAPWIVPRHALESVATAPNAEGAPGGYDAVRDHRRESPTPTLGPYRVVSFDENARLVAEANPHFIGPPPNIARFEIIRYEDNAAVRRAFEAGEVDITYPNALSVEDAIEMQAARPEAISIEPSAILMMLQPDLSHPLLSRLEGRRAILMAIDRARITEASYPNDTGRVAEVPVPGPLPEGTVETPYDPAGARALLEELDAVGSTLKLTYVKSPSSDVGVEILAENLRDVGITLEIDDSVTSTLSLFRTGDHGGLLMHVLRAARDSAPPRYWGVPLVNGNYDRDFRSSAYTDAVHALVERERRALYPERRDQLRDALFAEASKQLPMLPVMFAPERVARDPALSNWSTGAEVSFGSSVEQWYFESGPSDAADGP
jgi:ABC-type transport system substrate-binding protein